LYKIRTCSYNLSTENINKGKFKVCLEYHIGNCLGPCVGEQSEAAYNISVEEVRGIIKGSFGSISKRLKQDMLEYSANLEFEKAQEAKHKMEVLEAFKARSVVFSPSIKDVDVFSVINDEKEAYINFLKVMNGTIVQGQTIEVKKKLDETDEELIEAAILEFRQRFKSEAKEILLPFKLDLPFDDVEVHVPQRGDKKAILDMSFRNAKVFRLERITQNDKKNPHERSERILKTLQSDLRMQELPVHIECFDNSNFQGTNAVGACVVFKNAKPSKKDYRNFNIKTVEGADDFASMEEIVYRRYKRLMEENEPLPQLIIVDGGKGQLSSGLMSLDKLGLRGKIAIVGVAKRLEEIYFPGDSIPAYIDKRSESLKLIQHLRNEAHRFGITHHRNKRSKNFINSELSQIEGIGEKTVTDLLSKFKSVKRVKEAPLEELISIIGQDKGGKVFNFFDAK
jgi:excinuclease ABC subunit C